MPQKQPGKHQHTRTVTETDWSIWNRAAEANLEQTKLRFTKGSSIQSNKSQDGMGPLTRTVENMRDTEKNRIIEDAKNVNKNFISKI